MPLHPLVVHFPIALLLVATIIEIVNLFIKKESFSVAGTILFVLGVLSGLVTFLTGDPAEEFAYDSWGKGIHDTVELHSTMAGTSLILFGIVAAIKLFGKYIKLGKSLMAALVIVLSLAGTTTLSITGHLGGKIVYEHQHMTSSNANEAGDED